MSNVRGLDYVLMRILSYYMGIKWDGTDEIQNYDFRLVFDKIMLELGS